MKEVEAISREIEVNLPEILDLWRRGRVSDPEEQAAPELVEGMRRLVGVFVEFLRSTDSIETFSRGGRTRTLVGEVAGCQHRIGRDAVGVIEDFAALRRGIWDVIGGRIDFAELGGGPTARFFVRLMQASDWVTEAALEAFDSLVRQEMDEAMGRAAATDLLTGLPDRDLFGRLLLPRAIEEHEMLSLVIFDVAGLSEVVASGEVERARDAVRRLAETVSGVLPGEAVCARFGDDEVSALLPEVGSEEAYRLAEEVISSIRREDPDGLQVDAGVAEYPLHGDEANGLVNETLKALSMAKRVGGGGIVVARPRK